MDLLKPAQRIIAHPVIVNNLKQAAAWLAHLTDAEIQVFCNKVARYCDLCTQAQARLLAAQLRALIGRH